MCVWHTVCVCVLKWMAEMGALAQNSHKEMEKSGHEKDHTATSNLREQVKCFA